MPALSQRGRGRSTVRGTGDLTKCRIDYALRTDELAEGDWLLTAGGEGFFPKGLRIGRILSVQKKATGMFIGAELTPAVEFHRLDEVLVVLDQPPEPPPAPLPAPPPGDQTSAPQVPEPPHAVRAISALDREVQLDVTRQKVKDSPPWTPYDLMDRDYRHRLHSYSGWPVYEW